ncbi:DUF294 nucleotidyltransferase-like domain-containing protein [Paenibacillus allorhizosphaerae]|uniref:Signal transduction protein n=1 Tax=Paenibacillus allorhizosphaerae TaxID=2849866 RepID=A0ABM8VN29_9BACL|nr:DUF294 nucleotidyltransferase-like domain-containing protein [Paenibacillus allorhizosphaerae]CAG7650827.1 hypothetical protein PAECIP111802_04816 [Paenibacillus allorhizosphaerae]
MERLSSEWILQEIAKARNVTELRAFRDQAHEEFQRRLLFSPPLDWSRETNAFHDAVIRRAVEWAEQELKDEGAGTAPLPYAFLLFGSGGRSEQTLWSDQDNGLVYADPATEEERLAAEHYFPKLAAKIYAMLLSAGYPPCSGGVICTNERWLKPLTAYRSMLLDWFGEPDWEHVRYLLITADLRAIYGDTSLGDQIMDVFHQYLIDRPEMIEYLLRNTLHHKVSIGLFGQLIKERYGEDAGGVDIKYGAYIPIVNGVRLLALEAGVRSSSTEERIRQLIAARVLEEELGDDFLEALAIAMKLRSMTPFQIENGHYMTRGKLTAEQLTKERASELKLCLRIGNDLQKYVKKKVHREL